MKCVVFGKSLALFSFTFSGVIVETYSSILSIVATFKQVGHKQSEIPSKVKIGGKSLHQHLLESDSFPHPKGSLQTEQYFCRMLFTL